MVNGFVGAKLDDGGALFRVWAPKRRSVEVVLEASGASRALDAEADGYFVGRFRNVTDGARYRFRLDGGDALFPDPASRFQPEGPRGPSQIVDPRRFAWSDAGWRGPPRDCQVLYELHVGTFTPEGTWDAAREKLPALVELGVTLLEVMPIADFTGAFGWGYDGVNLFAPTRLYGPPDSARRFVDAAHRLGLGVILDVVYNHLGNEGNFIGQFSDDYFTTKHQTPWGPAMNFDGPGSSAVRGFVAANAAHWIAEYHFDGLRFDATQTMIDDSKEHVLALVAREARSAAAGRTIFLLAENEPQETKLVRSAAQGGYGLDAVWNDDFHHSAYVALTGRREAYYRDYAGSVQELVSAAKRGYLYQGQRNARQDKRRGTPGLDLEPHCFVAYLENHDQTANSLRGERLHALAQPGRHRAFVALLLLSPATPLVFQGEEFRSSAPFTYFADHEGELAEKVRRGRIASLSEFPSVVAGDALGHVPVPHLRATFDSCKLDWREREANAATLVLYTDLIALRRSDAVFSLPRRGGVDGAVLAPSAFVLRAFGPEGDDRLLLVNLGQELDLASPAEPLLAPPTRDGWALLWSSEDPRYGGGGTPAVDRDGSFSLPGPSAVVLAPAPRPSR
jgi:maltooligosyltrehalose trehalohydrolase